MSEIKAPGISLILGGARSGKSQFAEKLVLESGLRKIYLATSEALDAEMEQRIAHHQQRRGDDWELIEEPVDLANVLQRSATDETCILVDCLTLWVTNLMMADSDVSAAGRNLVETLTDLPKPRSIVLVSNEVGQGIVPAEKMAREFRDHAGRLHQAIAEIADNVWFVTAGLPQKLK